MVLEHKAVAGHITPREKQEVYLLTSVGNSHERKPLWKPRWKNSIETGFRGHVVKM
jgi:hypothetical protein